MNMIYKTSDRIIIPGQTGMMGVLLGLILLFSSCKKYVDVDKNSSSDLPQTAVEAQVLLNNYEVMNTGYPSDNEVSSDDYYLSDAGYLNSSLTTTDRELYTWNAKAIRLSAQPQWQGPYRVVYNANLVLETVDKLKGKGNQSTLDGLRGQALFFRAYAFWHLAQLYARPYIASTASQDQGIPLHLTANIKDQYDRSTVQQTYTQIIQDLQDAAGLLPATAAMGSLPTKTAAFAMLARVYLGMEDYPNALIQANNALALKSGLLTYTTTMANATLPFLRYNTEVIFQSLMSPSPILNPGTETNVMARLDQNLYNSYAANDLRRTIFFRQNKSAVEVSDPTPDNPNNKRTIFVNDGTYRFGGNYEPSIGSNLFNGLAVDELFLIRAECYARAGNTTMAMADLNTLLVKRWSGTYMAISATDPNDALAKVLMERRKELLMRGLRWTDARRLKLSLTRDTKAIVGVSTGVYSVTNNPVTYTVTFSYPVKFTSTLPANDPRFTLLIPNEVIVNSNGAIQQNLR